MENSIRSIMEYLCGTLLFEKITFSKSRDAEKAIIRTVATPFEKRGAAYVQLETFTHDGKAFHRNLPMEQCPEILTEMAERGYRQTNIHTQNGDCEIRFSKKEQCHIANGIKAQEAKAVGIIPDVPMRTAKPALKSHDRQKHYFLDTANDKGARDMLYLLGVCDAGGRIFDKKRPKFRQINRFLEFVDDIYPKFPKDGALTVYDLCCGKSYLTFAVYYFLTAVKGRYVNMYGIDLKPDVIAYCTETAEALGFSTLSFSCGDIGDVRPAATPDLVISLHACDIATDIVLANATKWGTRLVLSTPCCHHEIFHAMRAPQLSFITEHSMLGQKLADAATDALRCLWLALHDYDVQTFEFIDPEETPKNLMIRAVKRKAPRAKEERIALQKAYDDACMLLGCTPYLARTQDV